MKRYLLAAVLFFAAIVSERAHGQSGKSWMNGFVLTDSDTQGVQGAKVELIGDPSWERLRDIHLSTDVDDRGRYSMQRVPYGRYTFRVSAPGYETYEIPLYIASDMQTQIHVRLERAAQPHSP